MIGEKSSKYLSKKLMDKDKFSKDFNFDELTKNIFLTKKRFITDTIGYRYQKN